MFRSLLLLAAALSLSSDRLTVRSPAEVGMSPERLENITHVVNRGMAAGGFPGAAVIVGRKGAIVYEQGFGRLGWDASSADVSTDQSIYDLASLTKVVATTTAAMVLYDEGKLDLDAKVQSYVPGFVGAHKDEVTVRMLLAHRGGLPAGRTLWRKAHSPAEAKEMVLTTRLEYRPGKAFVYSDLGADLLGWIVEATSGEPLDQFVHERVFAPLGMSNTGFKPADSLRTRIAPTETAAPRGHPVRGEVDDENAYALGGIAGHAGLFSTANDLAVFAQMMLNRGEYQGVRIVADSTVRLFTGEVASGRALGWEVGAGEHGAGEYLDEHAFGHTGYTGTSLWIDPDRDMFVILLTNRVYAARVRRPSIVISDVRQDVADAAALSIIEQPYAIDAMPEAFRSDKELNWNRAFRARSRRHVVKKATTASRPASKPATPAAAVSRTASSKASAPKPAAKPKP